MPVNAIELAAALVVTAVGAVVQGTIGIGFGVLSVPILSLVNPVLAPVPQLLLAVPLATSMAWRERSHIESRGARALLIEIGPCQLSLEQHGTQFVVRWALRAIRELPLEAITRVNTGQTSSCNVVEDFSQPVAQTASDTESFQQLRLLHWVQ